MRLRWLAVLAVLAAVWGFAIEPNRLVLRETRLVLPRWPAALDGLRLAVVADIHAGAPWIDDEKVERLVAEVNATRPDLVLLLGDFVILEVLGGRPVPPERTAERLAGLSANGALWMVSSGSGSYTAARIGSRSTRTSWRCC